MATHSRTVAWKIPCMEKPGGLQSMGPQRVAHDWATSLVPCILQIQVILCLYCWQVSYLLHHHSRLDIYLVIKEWGIGRHVQTLGSVSTCSYPPSYKKLLFFHWVTSNSLQPQGLQHTRLPCPSLSLRACSISCPSSRWCHPTISSSVVPFSSCLQFFPVLGSFPVSWLFASGDQSIGASASALPMNIQSWFPLGLAGLISLQSEGLSRVFSNTTIKKHQFFSTQISLWSNSQIHTWLLEKS